MKWHSSIRKLLLPGVAALLSLGVLAFRSRPADAPSGLSGPASMASAGLTGVSRQRPPLLTLEENASRLVDAIIQVESGGNARMVGRHGERGLMQIRAGTWRDMTRRLFGSPLPFEQAFNPALNRRVGTAYLAWLQSGILPRQAEWKTDERSLLLAAYNAGPGRLRQSGFNLIRMPRQTRDYVARVSSLHDRVAGDQTRILSGIDRPVRGSHGVGPA